jgi:hypothetical protein
VRSGIDFDRNPAGSKAFTQAAAELVGDFGDVHFVIRMAGPDPAIF